jgi:hypothetical protein
MHNRSATGEVIPDMHIIDRGAGSIGGYSIIGYNPAVKMTNHKAVGLLTLGSKIRHCTLL